MDHQFQGYELLLLRRLQNDASLWRSLCTDWLPRSTDVVCSEQSDDQERNRQDASKGFKFKCETSIRDLLSSSLEVPHDLWYLRVTLHKQGCRFLAFVENRIQEASEDHFRPRESLLTSYMNRHQFTELHLDGIFKYGDDNTLPREIFRCTSVKWLSMKYNYLDKLPPDIGYMSELTYLSLTNNKLQNKSIPHTLTFCTKLKYLMLDNNLLDALPGFLLKMHSLETVHRHGNHNYFKSTFMWYHTDVNERILTVPGINDFHSWEPETLQFWAAKTIIGLKINFFKDSSVAPVLKDYISEIYMLFNVCGFCNTAKLTNQPGFKVITFKNPYLGNTCVPFQHWACSLNCAQEIEVPARSEQIAAARELDRDYDAYMHLCHDEYNSTFASSPRRLLLGNRLRRNNTLSRCINNHAVKDCIVS